MGFSIAATAIDAGNLGEARYSQLQSGQPPVNVSKNRPYFHRNSGDVHGFPPHFLKSPKMFSVRNQRVGLKKNQDIQ